MGMPVWQFILTAVILFIVTFILYGILRTYVFSKIKINKWIILSLGIIIFILPSILGPFHINMYGTVWKYISPVIVALLFIWFLDILRSSSNKNNSSGSRAKHNKNIVIKPKAKPNRVKNMNKNKNSNNNVNSANKKK